VVDVADGPPVVTGCAHPHISLIIDWISPGRARIGGSSGGLHTVTGGGCERRSPGWPTFSGLTLAPIRSGNSRRGIRRPSSRGGLGKVQTGLRKPPCRSGVCPSRYSVTAVSDNRKKEVILLPSRSSTRRSSRKLDGPSAGRVYQYHSPRSFFTISLRSSTLTSHQFRVGAQIRAVRLMPFSPILSTNTDGAGFFSANGWVAMTPS